MSENYSEPNWYAKYCEVQDEIGRLRQQLADCEADRKTEAGALRLCSREKVELQKQLAACQKELNYLSRPDHEMEREGCDTDDLRAEVERLRAELADARVFFRTPHGEWIGDLPESLPLLRHVQRCVFDTDCEHNELMTEIRVLRRVVEEHGLTALSEEYLQQAIIAKAREVLDE